MPSCLRLLTQPMLLAFSFELNGSSYEWNAWYNGRPVDKPRFSNNPLSDAFLMYDYERFHDNGRSMNVLYADFHVGSLKASASVQGTSN